MAVRGSMEQRFDRYDSGAVDSSHTQLLKIELNRQSKVGPGVEPPTAAMFKALLQDKSEPIRALLAETAEQSIGRRKVKSAAAVSALRTALIDYFVAGYAESGQPFSDIERLEPKDWQEPIDMLKEALSTEAYLTEANAVNSLRASIAFREAATPVASRYYPAALIAGLAKDRFPNGIRALDLGSSIMVGALQLVYSDEFPMSFKKVTSDLGHSEEDLTGQSNRLLARQSNFKEVVAVDVFPFYYESKQRYDYDNARYSLSGLRPSERTNRAYLKRTLNLMKKKEITSDGYDPQPKVIFHRGNLLKPDERLEFEEQHLGSFDIITANYITQELSPADQLKFHNIAESLLAENGILMYIHQARLEPRRVKQPSHINRVRPYESYATIPYRSNMHLVDNLHPLPGVQEVMGFYDNRCQEARLYAGHLMVNGELEPIHDLIKHAA